MSNMTFLIADVIQFLSDTNITFTQRRATKIRSKQFSEFGPELDPGLYQTMVLLTDGALHNVYRIGLLFTLETLVLEQFLLRSRTALLCC